MPMTIQPTVFFAGKKGTRVPGDRSRLERLAKPNSGSSIKDRLEKAKAAKDTLDLKAKSQLAQQKRDNTLKEWESERPSLEAALKQIQLESNGVIVNGIELLDLIGDFQLSGKTVLQKRYFSGEQIQLFNQALDILVKQGLIELIQPKTKPASQNLDQISLTDKGNWLLETLA